MLWVVSLILFCVVYNKYSFSFPTENIAAGPKYLILDFVASEIYITF